MHERVNWHNKFTRKNVGLYIFLAVKEITYSEDNCNFLVTMCSLIQESLDDMCQLLLALTCFIAYQLSALKD